MAEYAAACIVKMKIVLMSHTQFFWANFSAKYVIIMIRREIMDKGKKMYVITASASGINGADGTKSCIDKCKLMSQAVQY